MIVERLKCFGGPNDGEVYGFEHGQTEIVLSKRRPLRPFVSRAPELVPLSFAVEQTRYTRRTVRSCGKIVAFLAPADWDDLDALRWILAP